MKKLWLIKILALLIASLMLASLAACNFSGSGAGETDAEGDTSLDGSGEDHSDGSEDAGSEDAGIDETDGEDSNVDTGEDETQGDQQPVCEHPYDSNIDGHWKPACDICGKPSGSSQPHEYEQRLEDEGDAWLYVFRCKLCKYSAYELSVPYTINSFYSAGELAGIDTNKTFTSDFYFDAGTGYAGFKMSGGGSGTVKVVESEDTDLESGRYAVMKVRLPSSQTGFTVSIKSVGSAGSYSMAFADFNPGWATVVVDLTTAVGENKEGEKTGYVANSSEEYYLGYFGINGRVTSGEHFDVSYVMFCDTLDEAIAFTENERQLYVYSDISTGERTSYVKPCTDADGNIIEHKITSDENGHTVEEACHMCGLEAVRNEAHSFTQLRVDGKLTYACSVCNYLQYGDYVNKYFSAADINNNAVTYYKVNKSLIAEGELEFSRFTGRGTTAQVIFARNNYASSDSEEAAAFPVGSGHLLVVRMRTNTPAVKFRILVSALAGKEKEVVFPTALATVVSEPGAETCEYGWTTYIIDLPRAVPAVFVADENGEYKIHNLYFQMGTNTGEDYTADVYYDIDFMAFVDTWSEVRAIVPDETVIKVNATNDGTVVKTQEQECVGEHSWGENVEENTYTYLCVNCGKVLKSVTVPSPVKKYFSGYEVARNAAVYALAGTRSVLVDEDNTIFGRVNGCAEIWWMRDQKDYSGGTTGGSLDGKTIDVGTSKYMVVRLKTENTSKNFEFYISTTGKNGTPRTEEEVTDKKPITVPTTSGMTTITSPVQASVAGEWTTYVFDLEALIPEFYVKDEATGHYILDTFGVPFSQNVDMDVEFIAFVEGGWAEIDALTPDETVVFATHQKNKTYAILDVATGTCAECTYTFSTVENADGSVTYASVCAGCGNVEASHTVSADVNQYYSLDKMSKHGATDNGIMAEGGVLYRSYNFSSTGHIFVNGKNGYTAISNDTGAYLVVKYRSSNDTSVVFETATADKNIVASWESQTVPSVDGDPALYVQAADAATEWRVMVICLDEFNYTQNSTENVQVRITTSAASIDVSYLAIVDDEAEARSLIDDTLDPTYVYYASKSASPVVKNTTDGSEKN